MSNSHHFYGSQRMRGGLTLDPETIPPNATYWENSASDALYRLASAIGKDEALRQTENITGTWREIYEAMKLLADLAEKQVMERRLQDIADEADLRDTQESALDRGLQ